MAVLSNDTFVSGSDDHMVSVWKRIPGTTDFSTVHVCPEAQHQLRAIEALPPSPTLPTGGFAAAGLDKTIRIYSYDEATGKASSPHCKIGAWCESNVHLCARRWTWYGRCPATLGASYLFHRRQTVCSSAAAGRGMRACGTLQLGRPNLCSRATRMVCCGAVQRLCFLICAPHCSPCLRRHVRAGPAQWRHRDRVHGS